MKIFICSHENSKLLLSNDTLINKIELNSENIRGCFCFLNIQYQVKMPKVNLEEFYVLACSSAKCGPILDFLGSTDSLDPGDFKYGLKMAKKAILKATEAPKKRPDF